MYTGSYVIFTQHCQEIYITVANVRPRYVRLLDREEESGDELTSQFLELQLYGPLKILTHTTCKCLGGLLSVSQFNRS